MQNKIETNHNVLYIGLSTNKTLNDLLKTEFSGRKKIILTDDNVFEYWIEQLVTSVPELSNAEIIQLPAGEDSKCIEIVMQVLETLSENKIERNDLILNFGGGVITDLGGFIASIYKRGIPFINIPTSLLSQIDASIGGKTGIDLGPHKNQIGTFNHANAVLINPNYLSTLPSEELKSGYAEMLKHGLIASQKHWNDLKHINYSNVDMLTTIIFDSIQIKHQIVDIDPHEKNIRKALNFGHTIGHAIEGYFIKTGKPIKHGYAIACGMIAESYISYKKGILDKKEWNEVHYILTDLFDKIIIDPIVFPQIMRLMENDKKNKAGKINFTLLTGIGTHIINQEVSKENILEALEHTLV
ncbi:MAG: 3-dehydroquinate synthase [Crocinitomicaceae bacterium]